MKTKAPPTRHKFDTVWDEIGYLHDKLLYWFYNQWQPRKARPFARRLKRLLDGEPASKEAILAHECRSLLAELWGDLPAAIEFREKEIRSIKRLHEISRGEPNEKFILEYYGPDDLSDRLDLLGVLYRDKGDLAKALAVLRESKKLCEKHDIPFDGQDLLDEYLAESKGLERTG